MSDNPQSTGDWWLGYLAGNIRAALSEPAATARARLREALGMFTDSPACHPELREALGKQPRHETAALNDGYDLDTDWKPCANPECRTPIPRRSRKAYCDALCRNIALEYAHESRERESVGQSNEIPF